MTGILSLGNLTDLMMTVMQSKQEPAAMREGFVPNTRLYKKHPVRTLANCFKRDSHGDLTEDRADLNRLQRACLNRAIAACDAPRQQREHIVKPLSVKPVRRYNNA